MPDLREMEARAASLHTKLAESIGNPTHARCIKCGAVEEIDAAHCFAHGWPKCCGATMGLEPKP